MNIPNNKKRKSSIEKIEKTFLQLIQNKNIEEISVSMICKIAKLNRSTFYSNYIDMYDLLEKVKKQLDGKLRTKIYQHERTQKRIRNPVQRAEGKKQNRRKTRHHRHGYVRRVTSKFNPVHSPPQPELFSRIL